MKKSIKARIEEQKIRDPKFKEAYEKLLQNEKKLKKTFSKDKKTH